MRTFDFISDPGHGWVKVPLSLLGDLGLLGKISSFSYFRGLFAYLEEDCDASKFIQAYRDRFGADPKFRDRVSRRRYSKIRSYASFELHAILASLQLVKVYA